MTQYGLPQAAVYPAVLIAAMAGYYILANRLLQPACACPAGILLVWLPEVMLFAVLIWVLSFFRDPPRTIVQDARLLLSPADGTVMAVEELPGFEGFDGPVLRVEIFLSIFNVHINRMPCRVQVGTIHYKPGQFLDARNPQCSKVNEANEIELFRLDDPKDRLLVRQISGAIARRIVCDAATGRQYPAGEKFGMIKFGSCTELYVPARSNLVCMVKKGDKVKAGLTIIARYQEC
ncbi:MAG TPA: phosphatidylserine decarboxylase [Anaerohalosphaeraceae bacterium]|nr:phosphatidylserine decarboxylase [Anaerohalosphaeraceae bacterium]HRV21037.1 phosphatidylserine decarboxylase [Anaerohalosphaeraceae bacterium]